MRVKHHMVAVLALGMLLAGSGTAHAALPTAAAVTGGTAGPAGGSVGLAGSAGSSVSTTGDAVEIPPELREYLEGLAPEEQERFVTTMLPATTTISYGEQTPADAAAATSLSTAKERGRTVSPLASGCWTLRVNGSSKAVTGNTLYTYYHVGYWCASGNTVTSAKVLDRGGETKTPGWRWAGAINGAAGVVSNQGRSYSQVKFVLRVGAWDVQSPTPCLRINGLSSGTGTSSKTCGIY